jgi:hypothetical protein
MKNFFDNIISKLVDSFGVSANKSDSTINISRNTKIGIGLAILFAMNIGFNALKNNPKSAEVSIKDVNSYESKATKQLKTEAQQKHNDSVFKELEKQGQALEKQEVKAPEKEKIAKRKAEAIALKAQKEREIAYQAKKARRENSIYIRGPRGGCYYINSRGKPVYVDRSLCN